MGGTAEKVKMAQIVGRGLLVIVRAAMNLLTMQDVQFDLLSLRSFLSVFDNRR